MVEKNSKINDDLNDFLNEDFKLDESFLDIDDDDNSFYQDHPADVTRVTIPIVTILSRSDNAYKTWVKDEATKNTMKKVFGDSDDSILALKIRSSGEDEIDNNIKKIFPLAEKMKLTHDNGNIEEVFYMNLNDTSIKNLELTFVDGQRTVYMDRVKDNDPDDVKKVKQSFNGFIVSDYKTYPTNVGKFIDDLLLNSGVNIDKSLLFKQITDSKNAVKMGKDNLPLLNYFSKYRSISILSFVYNNKKIEIPVLFMLRTASYLHTQNKYFGGKSLTSSYDKAKKLIKAKTLVNIKNMKDEDTKNIYVNSATKDSTKVPVIDAESIIKDMEVKDFILFTLKAVNLLYKMSNKIFNPSEIENTTYKSNLSYILFGKVKCKYESNMFIDGDNRADFLKITSQNIVKQIPQNIKVVTNNDVIPDFDMNDL
jgi:hypothetical protein